MSDRAGFRAGAEFFVILLMAGTLFRGFVAEAFLVKSGSMAPALFGFHRHAVCPDCGRPIDVGVESDQPPSEEIQCPGCGKNHWDISDVPISAGDRLVVQKWTYQLRSPRRWEPVVFLNPNELDRPFIKRVVGLPGESVQLLEGDVYIDGRVARKSFEEFDSLAVLVHEHRLVPAPAADGTTRADLRWHAEGSGWDVMEGMLRFEGPKRDEIAYRHRDRSGFESAVRDECPYNPSGSTSMAELAGDLVLKMKARYLGGNGRFEIRHRVDPRFVHTVRFEPASARVEFFHNGKLVQSGHLAWSDKTHEISFGLVDRRIMLRVDGRPVIEDLLLDGEISRREKLQTATSRPFVLMAEDLSIELEKVQTWRDVHYRSNICMTPIPAGVETPFHLGEAEFFVLGDNSPISNDSRAWEEPAIPASLLMGKPILIHLPTTAKKIRLFGREVQYSVPNFSRVRRMN